MRGKRPHCCFLLFKLFYVYSVVVCVCVCGGVCVWGVVCALIVYPALLVPAMGGGVGGCVCVMASTRLV